jgi:hypothetical protein
LIGLRLRDLVLVVSDGKNHADTVAFNVASACILDRIVLPQDPNNRKPFIPWAASGKPIYLPVNSRENNFKEMDRAARELVSAIHVLRHAERDSSEHARSWESLVDLGASLIGNPNRMRFQDRQAAGKKRRQRLAKHIENTHRPKNIGRRHRYNRGPTGH